jgi:hypothetical protein
MLLYMYNRPFAHSRFDSKIIHFYTFFIKVISLTMGKIAPSQARVLEDTGRGI